MLVLVQDLGEPYAQLLDKTSVEEADLIAVQSETMGFDHTKLFKRFLENWHLPRSLVTAVGCFQIAPNWDLIDSSDRMLLQVICQAEMMAQLLADRRSWSITGQLLHRSQADNFSTHTLNRVIHKKGFERR